MHALRTGCPWDAEQTHTSLLHYLVEETAEVVDAIETGTDVDLREELGDLLLQIAFHSELASERDAFTIDDVARGQWLVEAGLNPNDTDAEEEIARITNTTYDATSIPMNLPGNYVSLRFTSEGDGYAKIAAACIRYDGAAGEDVQ